MVHGPFVVAIREIHAGWITSIVGKAVEGERLEA